VQCVARSEVCASWSVIIRTKSRNRFGCPIDIDLSTIETDCLRNQLGLQSRVYKKEIKPFCESLDQLSNTTIIRQGRIHNQWHSHRMKGQRAMGTGKWLLGWVVQASTYLFTRHRGTRNSSFNLRFEPCTDACLSAKTLRVIDTMVESLEVFLALDNESLARSKKE
jgi:hypothetical protein